MKKPRIAPIFLISVIFFCITFSGLVRSEKDHSDHKHNVEAGPQADTMHGDHGEHDAYEDSHDQVHGPHNSHDDSKASSEHDHHGAVSIKKEDIGLFEVELSKVKSGEIRKLVNAVGEVSLNGDTITHIVPRATGIVKAVSVNIGQNVKKGDLLASLESIELADAKSRYLSELERMTVKKEIFELVEKLKKQGVSFSKEYLGAKSDYAEANIQFKNAKQKLLTYGLKENDIEKISKENIEQFMKFDVTSPVDGIILEKHISIGEFVKDDRDTMTIANLDDVWVNLNVFQDDIPYFNIGKDIRVSSSQSDAFRKYKIAYSSPVVNETTRTAIARIIADNKDNFWRPGEFVRGATEKSVNRYEIIIPKSSVQNVNDKTIVFVEDKVHAGTFFPKEVILGESDDLNYEVKSGLTGGETIVSKGSFALKAQATKTELDDGHNH